MNDLAEISKLIAKQLGDPGTQWSLGVFGGIAEFSRDGDEQVTLDLAGDAKSAFTRRGGVRISSVMGLRPFASESIGRHGWNHRVALCLPEADCVMNQRVSLAELGTDTAALREEDRDAVLFDLGLGAQQSDLCVRVSEPAVVAELRKCVGRSVFDADNPAMVIILAANPHRVFISRVGRVEVYQPIPSANGQSPDGPHTHVLPKLLRHRRTHAATEPIPQGWIPCAHFYPRHPMKDGFGKARPFDHVSHEAFQSLLASYGDPSSYVLKKRVTSLVVEGQAPHDGVAAPGRLSRANIRLALRQLAAANEELPALKAWLSAYDRVDDEVDEEDQQTLGH